MSLYNAINGVNQSTFFILPMLGKHPDFFPRFRDCFINADNDEYKDHIMVYTRTGGNNREYHIEENHEIEKIPGYAGTWDDDYDSTYAFWAFKVPEKWKKDFEFLKLGDFGSISQDYRDQMKRVFPKLEERFDELFKDFDENG